MSRRYKGGVISATAPTTSTSAATGVWTLPQQMQAIVGSGWPFQPAPPGSESYTTAGTFTWVAPAGVTSVSVVAVGGRGDTAGCVAGGGGLGYKNNYSVTPGSSYSVQVGGSANSGTSFFVSSVVVAGFGNSGSSGGCYVGDGGGAGGRGDGGGGGAGGYSGTGGAGSVTSSGTAGTGGAGGGGGGGNTPDAGDRTGGGGGGVGLFGQGSNGAGGAGGSSNPSGGGGGSGGTSGTSGQSIPFVECGVTYYETRGGNGGSFGGGKGRPGTSPPAPSSGGGAVRIVWPGATRTFPSTCVGAP